MLGSLNKRRSHIVMLILLTLAMVLPGLASLPVIDRDEARYAQASVQMAETGDLLNIRFQDEARNKKPAGVYWAQTAMIKTFARDGKHRIWAQRLPSVIGALLTILALYWGGLQMVGRKAALIACALLATSFIFVFEGHIAKTDALLCASTTLMLAGLGRLRNGGGKREVWAVWIALGASIMIKGPIGLLLIGLTLSTLWAWERNLKWARPLLNWGAILTFILMWLPWAVAMYVVTDGAFFVESLGNDLGGKIVSGQENHGAPPGAHSLAIWATLWPASLFLLPGLVYGVKAVRSGSENTVTRAMRFCLAWAIPFWIIIEIMPTKLPHYGLPVFPALCLMMGAAILALKHVSGFSVSRFISGLIFLVATTLTLGVVLFAQSQYGPAETMWVSYAICGVAGLAAVIAAFSLWAGKSSVSLWAALISSAFFMVGTYGYILPNIDAFNTSERVSVAITKFAPDVEPRDIHSPHYTEPSFVYHVGTEINVKGRTPAFADKALIILDMNHTSFKSYNVALENEAKTRDTCIQTSDNIRGFNYSKGDAVDLIILKAGPCSVPRASSLPEVTENKPVPE